MIELPDKKKCFSLPEQVAQNLRNITFLAEQYKNIDALPAIWQVYKEEFDSEMETFEGWTTTFEGWDETLSTYLANMSSAAVSAIAGQNIAPANVAATGNITAPSIIENMSGYTFTKGTTTAKTTIEYVYGGCVKNGNKLTLAIALNLSKINSENESNVFLGRFVVPADVYAKLFPSAMGGSYFLAVNQTSALDENFGFHTMSYFVSKQGNNQIDIYALSTSPLNNTLKNYARIELTFLLSDNLAA